MLTLKTSKLFKVLCGSLLAGIATASTLYLYLSFRNSSISDEEARKQNYPSAEIYNRCQYLMNTTHKNGHISDDQFREIKYLMTFDARSVSFDVMGILGNVGNNSHEMDQGLKIISLLSQDRNSEKRIIAATVLSFYYRSPEARQIEIMLTNDSDPKVQNQARKYLRQIDRWLEQDRRKAKH